MNKNFRNTLLLIAFLAALVAAIVLLRLLPSAGS